ncbi:MAG: terminase family protein [candidate division Zixibacteria bacterium]|nr:terminase family protein [candidate division Zixibacteria bacterium]
MAKTFEPGRVSWRRALGDPVYFARKVLGIHPHPGQSAWLAGSNRPENLLATGNRWGKSYVQAIKLLHRAMFRIRPLKYDAGGRYTIVAASITQDQANIIFNTAVRIVRSNTVLSAIVKSIKRTPYPEMVFGNGAVLTARTTQNRGNYLLGNDYDLFSFDEAAFETDPEYLINDVIMMRLADRDGRLDLISTPNGKNWFYRRMLELEKDPDRGYVQFGDSRDNPYLSQCALDRRIKSLPSDRVAQNIAGQFVDNSLTIFSNADIEQALKEKTLEGRQSDHQYISGWDLARKKTYTVGMTFDVTQKPYRMVAFTRFNNRDWADVIEAIRRMQAEYKSMLVVDGTGLGDVILSELADLNPIGVIFSPRQKAELLGNLLLLHNRGEIIYNDAIQNDPGSKAWSLEQEMREVTWEDNNRYDAVMAMALAVWPKRSRILFPGAGPLPVRVTTL